MKKIVVGYDGSESAERALSRALAFCTGETTLDVVCAERLLPMGKGAPFAVDPIDVEAAKEALHKAHEKVGDAGVSGALIEARGDPAKALVDRARDVHADLLVVGARNHGPLGRALLGSVSTAVVHHAPCDVLVVR